MSRQSLVTRLGEEKGEKMSAEKIAKGVANFGVKVFDFTVKSPKIGYTAGKSVLSKRKKK